MLNSDNSVLLVVDLQEKLLPAIQGADAVVEASRKMIDAAGVLGIPVVATEQYPAGLGRTCAAIAGALGAAGPIEKVKFSACVEGVVARLRELKRANVIVVGIEAHVCVQQTVLELIGLGYVPYVCADAVGSRRAMDRDVALDRMRQAGAVVTTVESLIFEMLGQAGGEQFKRILKIVK